MSPGGRRLVVAGTAAIALAGGLYFGLAQNRSTDSAGAASSTRAPNSAAVTAQFALTDLQLPDLKGLVQPEAYWKDKVLVVNFWATWCGPCREEMPAFADIQRRFRANGVLFVGIGLDSADKMAAFAQTMKIDYDLLVGDGRALDLMRRLGNRSGALPFTIIVDRAGKIVDRHLGVVDPGPLDARLRALSAAG